METRTSGNQTGTSDPPTILPKKEYTKKEYTKKEYTKKGYAEKEYANLPRTSQSIKSRDDNLHVRTWWPADGDPDTGVLVVCVHGYGAHTNRPIYATMAAALARIGIGFVTLDFHGHGYSGGKHRGYVAKHQDLVDDVLALLITLFVPETTRNATTKTTPWSRAHGKKFFLMGHSMGGGVVLLVSHLLSPNNKTEARRSGEETLMQKIWAANLGESFLGSVFICPLIEHVVPGIVRAGLVVPLAKLMPLHSLPKSIVDEAVLFVGTIWTEDAYEQYIKTDGHRYGGISYDNNIRFGTLASLLNLADAVQKVLPQTTFPFIILHDIDDKIVAVSGSQRLAWLAKSDSKTLVYLPQSSHDILANQPQAIHQYLIPWILQHKDRFRSRNQSLVPCSAL